MKTCLGAVEFRLLGTVEARAGGRLIDLGAARQRCLLAVLLIEVNRCVPADELVDRVWGKQRLPVHPRSAVHTYVSLLRRALADPAKVTIVRQPAGYLLAADEDAIDVLRFRKLIRHAGRAGSDDRSAPLLQQALGLWRGEAFGALDTPWLNLTRTALERERRTAQL